MDSVAYIPGPQLSVQCTEIYMYSRAMYTSLKVMLMVKCVACLVEIKQAYRPCLRCSARCEFVACQLYSWYFCTWCLHSDEAIRAAPFLRGASLNSRNTGSVVAQ